MDSMDSMDRDRIRSFGAKSREFVGLELNRCKKASAIPTEPDHPTKP